MYGCTQHCTVVLLAISNLVRYKGRPSTILDKSGEYGKSCNLLVFISHTHVGLQPIVINQPYMDRSSTYRF